MAKRADREEKEFEEIIEALREGYEELLEGTNSESGFIAFWIDQSGEMVNIRCSDGERGSIPRAEFEEIKNRISSPCLACGGSLGLIFDFESRPVLYLVCNRCEAAHRIVSGELCLTDK